MNLVRRGQAIHALGAHAEILHEFSGHGWPDHVGSVKGELGRVGPHKPLQAYAGKPCHTV